MISFISTVGEGVGRYCHSSLHDHRGDHCPQRSQKFGSLKALIRHQLTWHALIVTKTVHYTQPSRAVCC